MVRSGVAKVASCTSRSSGWAVEELPSSGDLDVYPVSDAPSRSTPSTVKSQVPSIVLKCANDQEFVELARHIGAGPERERLLQKLELRWSTAGVPLTTEPSDLPREAPLPTDSGGGGSVYISYRRSDAAHVAARLGDFLRNALGSGQVFLDVDSIKVGDTYADVLRTGIEHAMAVLVLIGPQWLRILSPTPDGGDSMTPPTMSDRKLSLRWNSERAWSRSSSTGHQCQARTNFLHRWRGFRGAMRFG